jgi:hypothetical protein
MLPEVSNAIEKPESPLLPDPPQKLEYRRLLPEGLNSDTKASDTGERRDVWLVIGKSLEPVDPVTNKFPAGFTAMP